MDAWEGPLLSPFADASGIGVSWDLDNWEGMTGTVLVWRRFSFWVRYRITNLEFDGVY